MFSIFVNRSLSPRRTPALSCLIALNVSFLVLPATAADWILSQRVNDSRLFSLVRKQAVLTDLDLSSSQQEAIWRLNDRIDKSLLPLRNRRQASREYSKLKAKTQEKLQEILAPHQFNRLAQIMFHVRGSRAVLTRKLQNRLAITAQQRISISEIIEATNAATSNRRQADELSNVHDLRTRLDDEDARVLKILTEQQLATLAKMSGRKFDRALLTSIRFKAPQFVDAHWIHTREPLDRASFRGNVLVVHFWAFG